VPATNLFDPDRVQPRGLTGLYREGIGFEGPPTAARVDPVISFYFHHVALPRPYTVEWKGRLYAPEAGVYTLATEQLSTSQFFLDGQNLITNNSMNNLIEAPVELTKGWHDIRILYTDQGNASHMYLYWTPPGKSRTIIPSAFLWPDMGQYPDPESGSEWPTLADADGTKPPADRTTWSAGSVPSEPGTGSAEPPKPQPQVQQPPPVVQVEQQEPAEGEALKTLQVIGNQELLTRPRGAGADDQGNIYLYTETDSKVRKYDPTGQLLKTWDVLDAEGKPLTEGAALVVHGGNVSVLDAAQSELISYTFDGELTGRTHMCNCFFPRDISVSQDGNFWITDTGGNKVIKASPTGQEMQVIGERGDGPGQFAEPAGVWEGPDGTLYVADIVNERMQAFGPDRLPVREWKMSHSVARDGNRVTGDSAGNVLVTNHDAGAIVMYDKDGKEIKRWFYRGPNGAVLSPAGLARIDEGKFIVLFLTDGVAVVFGTD
jgi:streptogramin lyase